MEYMRKMINNTRKRIPCNYNYDYYELCTSVILIIMTTMVTAAVTTAAATAAAALVAKAAAATAVVASAVDVITFRCS